MSKNKYAENTQYSKRIVLCFIILAAALLTVFGVMSFILTRINVSGNSMQIMTNTGALIAGLLNDHMKAAKTPLDDIVSDPLTEKYVIELDGGVSEQDSVSALSRQLDAACEKNADAVSAWVVSETGGMLVANGGRTVPAEEFALAERSWYQKYISGSVLNEYICLETAPGLFDTDENVVTMIAPLVSGGNTYAFCGVEIRADSFFSVLSRYTFNSGSYPIVECNSAVLYSPSEQELSDKISLSDPPLEKVISQRSVSPGLVDSYVSEKGGTVYYYRETSPLSGWNVIVLFDSDTVSGNVYKTFFQQIIALACLMALAVIFGINMLKRETAGLNELCGCTEEIAAGNLNYRINISDKTEIGCAAANINKIAEIIQAKNAVISSFDTTDTLTGLNNRVSLYEYMEDMISTREDGRSRFAVMFMDIDNFKWINETLGHTYGDAVLGMFGKEIKSLQYPVFRFSGDEFVIIKEFDTDSQAVYEVLDKLHTCFDKPLEVINDNIYIKFSIGVSIYPDDDLTPDLLLRDAELALHRAKESGKDRVAFYTNSRRSKSLYSKAAIARSLNGALKNGELLLHYQPIISAKSGDIHGFEVLLRWNSPEFGIVPPAEFIGVAEESGEIVQIGTWIFESACRTLKQINETLNPDVIMSINVSPVQLRRDNYIEHVKRVIDITQVNTKNIQLEITESTLIDFTDSKSNVINEINDMGIALALDDFGTGYSSLNYLKNFPIKCLKIDKSFIDEINNNQRDYAITDSIIDLVHNLGINTVAEGIETVGQYNFLADMKCDYIQGFLMSKPLDEAAAIEFVERYDDLHKPDKRMLEENERKLAHEREELDRRKRETDSEDSSEKYTEDFIISK
ncbi:MAG: EAL domain-containing protein [Prevotella sp.]|nr:EAL domain-containing protein [Prevotella sp.]